MWLVIPSYTQTFSCASCKQPELVCGLNLVHKAISSHGTTKVEFDKAKHSQDEQWHGERSSRFLKYPVLPSWVGSLFEDPGLVGQCAKLGLTGKLLQEGCSGLWAESSVCPWMALHYCRKLKSFEDEYGSSFLAGTLCSSEEMQTRVTGSAA